MSEPERPAPTKEELIARLEDLKTRAEAAQKALTPGVQWGRVFVMLGIPVLAAIATFVLSRSVLYAVLAFLGLLIVFIVIAAKLAPAGRGPRAGSRAWEAQMTADLLERVIADRRAEQRTTQDDARRDYLGREIAFLTAQLDENLAIWHSGDPSPGRGAIGYTAYDGS